MPGILPMKMIKIGASDQTRIAQACDRCRSKKIRCDGVRPCCSQCASVGFECKTSDKLSRRAFPRGYTESLEDRVRALEAEIRELKDLLDEKDEKIDMLSRLHDFSSPDRKISAIASASNEIQTKSASQTSQDGLLLVEIPPAVEGQQVLSGQSTIKGMLEAFERKVQRKGKPGYKCSSMLCGRPNSSRQPNPGASKIPPRLLSDQYINVFFQEWQPLLPVFHRLSILQIYEQYTTSPDLNKWQNRKQNIAQLFLIFDIAALSLMPGAKQSTSLYEHQWRKALYSCSSTASIPTLQCHVLAQIYYLLKGDNTHLTRHRGIAVAMCHELGLHQQYSYLNLSVLDGEVHKRVFWCQYILDKFTSAATGTPTLLRDADVSTEYPADVNDENITSQAFLPALPGEPTKISNGLALIRVSRILAKVLEELYQPKTSFQISLNVLHNLSDKLDQWSEELPDHLRLRFCNDKPATHLTGDRSPLLSLAYFFIRSLIHRPIVYHGSGNGASAATIVMAAAGKHILQILDLLDERRMNYTFPLSKKDLLLTAAVSTLWQTIDLDEDSKLVKDNQKSLIGAYNMLMKESQGLATDFHKVLVELLSRPKQKSPSRTRNNSHDQKQKAPPASKPDLEIQGYPTLQRQRSDASQGTPRFSMNDTSRISVVSRNSYSSSPGLQSDSTASLSVPDSTSSYHATSPDQREQSSCSQNPLLTPLSINLDYLCYSGNGSQELSCESLGLALPQKHEASPFLEEELASWDNLFFHSDVNNISNTYSVSPPDLHSATLTTDASDAGEWKQGIWPVTILDPTQKASTLQSHLSFSDGSMTSGEEFLPSTTTSNNGSLGSAKGSLELSPRMVGETYRGITMPINDEFEYQ